MGQVTIPTRVLEMAGLNKGDMVDFEYRAGKIIITPKVAADEYTPRQRRILEAQVKEGLKDIEAGRIYGPFDTADGMIAHMKGQLKKRAAKKTKPAR
jgi:bifunctional DNA-binding transcriptional regulator/antitoxin component of YhaV-PrlF toxin-antitoxin module